MKKDYGRSILRRKIKMSKNDTVIRLRKKRPFMFITAVSALALIGVGAVIFAASKANNNPKSNLATFVVKQGPLRISVTESGTIKARDQVILKNEVEGVTSILYLRPEGTRVNKGDLLVELDGSQLLDAKIDQQIKVQNTEAAFIGARENLALPTGSAVNAEVDIHETSLKKVRVGLPAIITVDALPGKTFLGKVTHIAPLPDATSMWMNPDLKVYNTEINVDGNDSSLRTGMSCKAEIVIAQYPDATYVPVQAVLRVAGETTVYVVNGRKIEPRRVEIGFDNNRMVRIMSGLQEGEVVLLTPPLKSAAVERYAEKSAAENPLTEGVYRTIDDRLEKTVNRGQYTSQGPPTDVNGLHKTTDGRRGKSGTDRMDPGRRTKMGSNFKNMSPEQREKMRKKRQDGNR